MTITPKSPEQIFGCQEGKHERDFHLCACEMDAIRTERAEAERLKAEIREAHEVVQIRDKSVEALEKQVMELKAEVSAYGDYSSLKQIATLHHHAEAMAGALQPVRQEIVDTGNLYKESDWNKDAHIEKPITLTVREARAILKVLPAYRKEFPKADEGKGEK